MTFKELLFILSVFLHIFRSRMFKFEIEYIVLGIYFLSFTSSEAIDKETFTHSSDNVPKICVSEHVCDALNWFVVKGF